MKSITRKYLTLLVLVLFTIIYSCKKDKIENPYDSYSTPRLYDEPILSNLPTSNFGYLHATVFKPTCANSGCHDGHFEPDFRTISSSFNSTVYHKVLTNDLAGTFTYRVKPGDAALSLLHERLLVSLPNTSGIMPAVSGSEWTANKSKHIKGVKDWINNGAKDMYGNNPVVGNPNPIVSGFQVFNDNNTTSPLSRAPSGGGITPFLIPRGNIDLWFSISDDITPPTSMTVNQVKISREMFEFDRVTPGTMSITGSLTATNFSGLSATFTHKLDFDASSYTTGTILYVRVYVQDANHTSPIENPSDGSTRQAIYLFTMVVN